MIVSTNFVLVLLVLVLSCCLQVSAHSSPPRPLKRVAHPSTLALEILPRQQRSPHDKRSFPLDSPTLQHSDSFRLTISVFEQVFYLHLRPNDHLIHPAARINYFTYAPNGMLVLSHAEPLLRESVKAYWGEVIPSHLSASRMREDAVGLRYRPEEKLGWARIMVHHQGDVSQGVAPIFEGVFSVNGVTHHIMTKDNYLRTKLPLDPDISLDDTESTLVIWRDSDVTNDHELATGSRSHPASQHAQTCGAERLVYNTEPLVNPLLRKRPGNPNTWYDPLGMLDSYVWTKRDDVAGGGMGSNFANSIGDTSGCPKAQKIVYMGVAADCMYVSKYGDQQGATQKILTNWNAASALYKTTFNVSLGIVELQVLPATCPPQPDPKILWNVDCSRVELNERLSLFSDWRGRKGNDGAGLWHLMSGCPTGSEVGIAWLGTLCEQRSSGKSPSVVSGTAVSTLGRTEWQIVAHETGHNFGAIHDCTPQCNATSPCCPFSTTSCDASSKFLMSPTAEADEKAFSPCTIGNICSMMTGGDAGQLNLSCLSDPDPNRQTVSLQMCGNGIVEQGEDCDPGKGVDSACCDSATCKFRPGAICDPASSPCCTSSCAFAPAQKVCRPARDPQCDKPENCTGKSASCPPDLFAPNGQSCGPNGLACASGQCTSIAKQCQTAGQAMGLTMGCPQFNDRSCQLSCQDPQRSGQCVLLQSPLVDGSPCGLGGTCLRGNCQAGDLASTAKAWFTSNLQISIPITVVAGIVALILIVVIYRSFRRCCRRSRRRQLVGADPALNNLRGERLPSWGDGPVSVVPGVPPLVPPRPQATTYDSPAGIPTALQIGSRPPHTRMPPAVHLRGESASSSSQSHTSANNRLQRSLDLSHGARPQFPTHPIRNTSRTTEWVDDTLYNGPRHY